MKIIYPCRCGNEEIQLKTIKAPYSDIENKYYYRCEYCTLTGNVFNDENEALIFWNSNCGKCDMEKVDKEKVLMIEEIKRLKMLVFEYEKQKTTMLDTYNLLLKEKSEVVSNDRIFLNNCSINVLQALIIKDYPITYIEEMAYNIGKKMLSECKKRDDQGNLL